MQLSFSAFLPFASIGAVVLYEYLRPCRPATMPRLYRWGNMAAIKLFGKAFFWLLLPISEMQFAAWWAEQGYGLFNMMTLPAWLAIALSVVILDFSSYAMHVIAHQNQFIWRAHRTHHMDTEFDITTALRTHPFDDSWNALGVFALVALFGVPAAGVLAYYIFASLTSKFSHGNFRLPPALNKWLGYVIVTPDMHRIHHSAQRHENDSNYSNHFSFWDRIFGTYRAEPDLPHATMQIGLKGYRDPGEIRIDRFLLRPFHHKEYNRPPRG